MGGELPAAYVGEFIIRYFIDYSTTLFRVLARSLRVRRSRGWRETTATVAGANCRSSSSSPCAVVEIVYTYPSDEGLCGGADEKPFFLKSSAERYACQFTRGDSLVIRVKPGDTEISVVRDEDQSKVKESTTNSGDSSLT
jgi:hypothetical protein